MLSWKTFLPFLAGLLVYFMLVVTETNISSTRLEMTVREQKHEEYKLRSIGELNCSINKLRSLTEFFSFLEKPYTACSNLTRFGGEITKFGLYDGDKLLCLDKDVKPRLKNCTVLSFGINNEWSFDDEMGRYGCRVHSFDPTMAMKSHMRSPLISFHNYGVDDSEKYKLLGGVFDAKMYRYEDILSKIGELHSTIDYLKMDIEGSELGFWEDTLKSSLYLWENVRQFGVEIHLEVVEEDEEKIPRLYQHYWKYFQLLECIGYRIASIEPNTAEINVFDFNGSLRSKCHEMLFVGRNLSDPIKSDFSDE